MGMTVSQEPQDWCDISICVEGIGNKQADICQIQEEKSPSKKVPWTKLQKQLKVGRGLPNPTSGEHEDLQLRFKELQPSDTVSS